MVQIYELQPDETEAPAPENAETTNLVVSEVNETDSAPKHFEVTSYQMYQLACLSIISLNFLIFLLQSNINPGKNPSLNRMVLSTGIIDGMFILFSIVIMLKSNTPEITKNALTGKVMFFGGAILFNTMLSIGMSFNSANTHPSHEPLHVLSIMSTSLNACMTLAVLLIFSSIGGNNDNPCYTQPQRSFSERVTKVSQILAKMSYLISTIAQPILISTVLPSAGALITAARVMAGFNFLAATVLNISIARHIIDPNTSLHTVFPALGLLLNIANVTIVALTFSALNAPQINSTENNSALLPMMLYGVLTANALNLAGHTGVLFHKVVPKLLRHTDNLNLLPASSPNPAETDKSSLIPT